MKLVTVVGIILVGLGTLLLAYFASPVRLLFQATLEHHKINPVLPIFGGIPILTTVW